MKTTSKKIAPWVAALLGVTMIGAFKAASQGYGVTPRTDQPTRNEQAKPATTTGQPARYNRASGIVGMNVLNEKSERLGEIKDVVFDLQSERVAYAVLQTGTGILGHGKVLAVPLNAFSPGADERHLILRAEKAKVEAAAGLDRENWPSVTSPSWGADPFWEALPGTDMDKYKSKTPATPQPEIKPEPKY